ncbi:hydroxymethylbilane synthase [Actinomyces oris]|uniref:Hydroxymethylbilane synthase n=1 Tax=Actinomyces oris TaxID=544580 RepID=A0A1Q8VV12_9ACTO|nr:hydroxymethylbilane synthase [Actinomyces oris]
MTTTGTESGRLRLGTRGSRLALTQSGQVAEALMAAGGGSGVLDIDLVTVRTDGDGDRTPLRQLGGVGVFAARLRHALLDGEVDLVVHSFKDLPTQPVEGLEVICVPPREDPRDALCARDGLTLAALPEGARVGTGSPRRAAQLLAARPDLEVVDLRGNVPTRLARVRGLEVVGVGTDEPVTPSRADAAGDLDAVVLALSGLRRLGLEHCASEVLDLETMLPAPAQGALAVEARAGEDSAELARAVAALDDEPTRLAVTAERALMARLSAGCAAPVGAWARLRGGSREPWGEHAEHGTGGSMGPAGTRASAAMTPPRPGPGREPGRRGRAVQRPRAARRGCSCCGRWSPRSMVARRSAAS